MNFFEKIGNELSRVLFWVAGAAIFFMMVLTCADVVLRLLRRPIPGTYELVCFMGAVAVSFAMAHTSVQKNHAVLCEHLKRYGWDYAASMYVANLKELKNDSLNVSTASAVLLYEASRQRRIHA